LLLLAYALPAGAADPSVKPGATSAKPDPKTEVWQDAPIPPDVRRGQTIDVGFTIWNVADRTLSRVNSATVLVHAKTGKAAPTPATTRPDWPGHVIASVTVPAGGLGTIDVGIDGQVCGDDGTCVLGFFPYSWGGIGPPAEAPRSLLVDTVFHLPTDPFVPGTPFAVTADVTPRAPWDPAALDLPPGLEVLARTLRGVDLASATLEPVASAAGTSTFSGAIEIPPTNDLTLVLAFPAGNGHDREVIDRSVVRIATARGASPSGSPAASSETAASAIAGTSTPIDVPILPLGLGAAAIVVALIVRRVFADL
jgi:hypothetical protein